MNENDKQAEPVETAGRIYAWVYVDQYGIDSAPTAKEWCEEMIRLHGGSMFPLYTRPHQAVEQKPVAYRVTVDFMGKTREFFTDLYSVAETLKTHRDGFIQPLYTAPPAAAINEQLLEALRAADAVFGYVHRDPEKARKIVKAAIAAAEAAKRGVL